MADDFTGFPTLQAVWFHECGTIEIHPISEDMIPSAVAGLPFDVVGTPHYVGAAVYRFTLDEQRQVWQGEPIYAVERARDLVAGIMWTTDA
jgi:hypothetical protein